MRLLLAILLTLPAPAMACMDVYFAMRDMLNGTISEPAGMIRGSLAQGWEDSLIDGIAEKWDVDPVVMGSKLRALTYPQEVAVIHSVEVWWAKESTGRAYKTHPGRPCD